MARQRGNGRREQRRAHNARPTLHRTLRLPVGIHVYTSAIYQAIHQYPSQIGLAAAYAITLLLITSFDNEERHTQAKKILTYSLIGFVFVALAFALVKAITNIDFFNFI